MTELKEKKHDVFYTEEEKQIIIDHILLKKDSCKKNFEIYLASFIRKMVPEANEKNDHAIVSKLHDFRYDSHHYKWGNEKDDNIVTYLLSHPKMEVTNGRLRDINKLHPDWNHVNREGYNAIHLLAMNCNFNVIKKISRDFPLNMDLKDKNDNYFTFHLIESTANLVEKFKNNDKILAAGVSRIQEVGDFFQQYDYHFNKISKTKLNKMIFQLENIKSKLINICVENTKYNEYAVEHINSSFKNVELFLNYHSLNKELVNNSSNKKVSKI